MDVAGVRLDELPFFSQVRTIIDMSDKPHTKQLFQNDADIRAFFTQKVIDRIQSDKYSHEHWNHVAKELIDKHTDKVIAHRELTQGIEQFHLKYKDAVVKSDNLLHDLIETCFTYVQWSRVASIFISLD